MFRRNFPDYSAGFSVTIPFRNRAAQADYVTDQLLLRQAELQLQRAINQVRLDVKNAVIGLQQARARYRTAVDTRVLAEQSLKAEQSRILYGVSTVALVIQAQKDLAQYQSAEVQAMANYTHARIAVDQAVGRTLDVNHVSFEEAVSGRVARQSVIPDSVAAKRTSPNEDLYRRSPLSPNRAQPRTLSLSKSPLGTFLSGPIAPPKSLQSGSTTQPISPT